MADQYLYKGASDATAPPSVKIKFTYLSGFLFLGAIIYVLTLMSNHDQSGSMVLKAVQLVAFLLLGMFSVFILRKYYVFPGSPTAASLWRISFLEGLLIAVAITVVYFITGIVHLLMAAASIGAFLLPVVVAEAFAAFQRMPGVAIITWQPAYEINEKRVQYKKNSELKLKLKKKISDPAEIITVKVSEYDQLGLAFNQLTGLDYGATAAHIDSHDDNGHSYDWSFFTSDPVLGKRWLDPFATLRTNKITPHTLVIVKRIKTTDI